MVPTNHYDDTSMTADSSRPPQYCTCNIGCGCRHVFGEDDKGSDANAHRQYTQRALRSIVQEYFVAHNDDISNDGRSLPDVDDADEGLEDHQTGQHSSAADFGHEMRQHIAHHYVCDCTICPYRRDSQVKEWLNYTVGPETPGSMHPEYGSSGEHSMASSMFLDPMPQTPGQLVVETGGVFGETFPGRFHQDEHDYVTSPLWLTPERMVPHQLDSCIPEESEPDSEDERT